LTVTAAQAEAQLAAENRALRERLNLQKGRDIKTLDDEIQKVLLPTLLDPC
jgi:hypothetical protein